MGGVLRRLARLQHGMGHLRDGALLGFGQRVDLFELLLQLRRRSAFAGAALEKTVSGTLSGKTVSGTLPQKKGVGFIS